MALRHATPVSFARITVGSRSRAPEELGSVFHSDHEAVTPAEDAAGGQSEFSLWVFMGRTICELGFCTALEPDTRFFKGSLGNEWSHEH